MAGDLFRKKALDALSSPEQLDQLVYTTSAKSWIALLTLLALIIAAILWGIFGRIPTKVAGTCVLVKTGGTFDIKTTAAGRVSDIAVRSGDDVAAGEVIARISQESLLSEVYLERGKLRDLKKKEQSLAEVREMYKDYMGNRISNLKTRYEVQQKLLDEGLITKETLLDTKQQREESAHSVKKIEVEEIEVQNSIRDVQRTLDSLQEKFEKYNQIIAPYSGRVISVQVNRDNLVQPYDSIATIERTGKNIKHLESVVYVPAIEGTHIQPGMRAEVSPAGVQKQEYGVMLGNVVDVSEYPVSSQAIQAKLNNADLVKQLSQGGVPIEVTVDLVPDVSATSGYKWTSEGGPPIKMNSGTLCSAQITVKEQRPISLVIPLIKKIAL